MRYHAEYWKMITLAALVLAVLVFVAYRPQTETPGDGTPLEHELGGDPPSDVRQP
jgi:hypothetical protein